MNIKVTVFTESKMFYYMLMNFLIHIDTITITCPLRTLMGHQWNSLNCDMFLSLHVVLIYTNSTDPDKIFMF